MKTGDLIKPIPNTPREKMPKRNKSGYMDPVAFAAVVRADKEAEKIRFQKMLHEIQRLCEENEFSLGNRIVLVDQRTGRVWK